MDLISVWESKCSGNAFKVLWECNPCAPEMHLCALGVHLCALGMDLCALGCMRVRCGRVSVLSGRIRAPRDRIAEHESARILILHAMLGARLARRAWDSAPLQG